MKKLIGKAATVIAAGVLLLSTGAVADDIQMYADSIVINKSASTDALSLSVAGPKDHYFRSPAGSSKAVFGLAEMSIVSDGLYNFEVKQYIYRGEETIDDAGYGRGRTTKKIVDVKASSGHFRVKNGAIVLVDKTVKEEGS